MNRLPPGECLPVFRLRTRCKFCLLLMATLRSDFFPPVDAQLIEPVRVLVVDDHAAVRDALLVTLSSDDKMEVCARAETGTRALECVKRMTIDVAVVDLLLRDMHGLELIRQLDAMSPGLKIVVFTMFSESAFAERAFRAGARGYVNKSEPTQRVAEAIRVVCRGDIFVKHTTARRLLNKAVRPDPVEAVKGMDRLTNQEVTVLQMLRHAYTVEEIANWLKVTPRTVGVYRRRASEKLGIRDEEMRVYGIDWTVDAAPALGRGYGSC